MSFTITFLYKATIGDYGDLSAALSYVWPLAYSITLANICTSMVQVSLPRLFLQTLLIYSINIQGFSSYRLYGLSRRWWLPAISWTGILIRLGLAFATNVIATNDGDLIVMAEKRKLLILLGQGTGLAVDVFNTVCLCVFLWFQKARFSQ